MGQPYQEECSQEPPCRSYSSGSEDESDTETKNEREYFTGRLPDFFEALQTCSSREPSTIGIAPYEGENRIVIVMNYPDLECNVYGYVNEALTWQLENRSEHAEFVLEWEDGDMATHYSALVDCQEDLFSYNPTRDCSTLYFHSLTRLQDDCLEAFAMQAMDKALRWASNHSSDIANAMRANPESM